METLETNSSRTYFDALPPRPRGFRVNMLGSASGRAYLAFCPEQELEAVLARLGITDALVRIGTKLARAQEGSVGLPDGTGHVLSRSFFSVPEKL